jgi:hypothetical protein
MVACGLEPDCAGLNLSNGSFGMVDVVVLVETSDWPLTCPSIFRAAGWD